MNQKTFNLLVGLVFLVVAVMHLWRIINGMSVTFGSSDIPMWVSYAGIVIAGYLAYYGLKNR
ncbi:MAG: hypothetical protein Q7R69_01720 [bacterium]|nr:hypothetical protein [bacterium]